YALDRPRLVEAAWRGTAEPAQLLGPAVLLGRSADLVAGARSDPRRARRLLDGAGWTPLPDGTRVRAGRRLALTLVIGPPDFDVHGVMATVVQDQLREAGIDLRIVQPAASAAYRARLRAGGGCVARCGASCRTHRARASAGIECRSRRIAFLGKISHGLDDNAAATGGAPHRAPRHREDRRDPAPGTAQGWRVAQAGVRHG